MNQRQAFMQAIIEAPDDDTPRLVFADWLDDEGDAARAEFIRTQIALERLPADDGRRRELARREGELLQRHGWDWAEEVGGEQIAEWRYRRGFIEYIATSLQHPRLKIGELMDRAPIRHIRDEDYPLGLGDVAEMLPHLARLRGLEFWNLDVIDNDETTAFLSSPHLANLQTLIFHHCSDVGMIDDGTVVDALHSPHRRNLRELGLNIGGRDGPSTAVLLAMAGSDHLRNLRVLHIPGSGSRGGEAGLFPLVMRALVDSPNLAHLDELNLAGTCAPEDVWEELLASPLLRRLKRLWLAGATTPHQPRRYFTAFERPGMLVDLQTSFSAPKEAGRWSGQTWEERQTKYLAEMAPFLMARDADALERAFRRKCVQLAGEEVAWAVDNLDIRDYERLLRPFVDEAIAAIPDGGAVMVDFSGRAGAAHLFRLHSPLEFDSFPRLMGNTRSMPLAEHPGPPCLSPEIASVWERLPPSGLKPRAGRFYLEARAAAAFVRCLNGSSVTAYYEVSDPGLLFRL